MKKISFLFGMLATCITLQAAVEEISVSRALEIISALADGASTTEQYIVKGVVSEIITTDEGLVTYKNCDFWMSDSDNATLKLKAFRTNGINGAAFTVGLIAVGDTVRVQGVLMNYVNTTTSERLSEIYKGNLVEVVTENIYYNFDDANLTATVTYRGSSYDAFTNEYTGDVVIPATVTYDGKTYSVTSIGEYAFADCSSLTSVTIPNSVTSIGSWAFEGCSVLTSVTIPNSVKSIEYRTFSGCSGLTSVTIPNSVTSIDSSAFGGCSGLTSVTIPNSVESIGAGAFSGCSSLTSVTIGNSVTSIGAYAFYDCSSLTSVTIPNSVESIGAGAFSGCSGLTSVTIPNSVTSIGEYAFYNCSSLTSIIVESGNTKYDSRNNCNAIIETATNTLIAGCQSTIIPNSVTSIGEYAFYNCSGLTSITIPNSVTSIGAYAFYYSGLTSVTIPNSVTSIGDGAFHGCSSLTSVTIPNSVTSIGYSAFRDCSGLTSVTIGNSVTSIGAYAFYDCSTLTSVVWNAKNFEDFEYSNYAPFYDIASQITSFTFGDAVEHIPAYLCYGLSSLNAVTIPNSVTSIGRSAFSGCSSLTSVVWNAKKCSDFSYASYAPFYSIRSQITSVTFGDEVEHIPAYLCFKMNNLTSLTLPNSIKSIGDYAFFYCSGLAEVIIGNSITSIGNSAFQGCSALREITTLSTVPPTCGSDAFDCVPTAATLRCPCESREAYQTADTWSRFTDIRNTDVPDITLLTTKEQGSVQVEERLCESKSVVISATPQIGYAFARWSDGNTENPRTVLLAHDTTLTAEFGLAYSGKCGDNLYWEYKQNKLLITGSGDMYDFTAETQPWKFLLADIESVETSAGTTSVGASAFADCTKLKTVIIGNAVTNIGDSAFYGCNRLLYFTCYAEEPPFVGTDPFSTYNVYLKVPCSGLDAYKMYDVWRNFDYISCIGSEEVQVTEFNVTPSLNDAQFTWPAESGAATYELVISKDGVVFCTLTFNANGQLMGIAFAPGVNGPAAAPTTSGFQFTVTGLDEASHYTYTFDAKDADGGVIQHYAGEFNTEGSTVGLEQIELANIYTQDGRIVCEGEFRIYDLLGRDVTRLNGSLCGVYVVKSGNAAVKVVVK